MGLDRLGAGPFTVLEIYEPDYTSCGFVKVELPEPVDVGYGDETLFRCACCGSRLSWRVLLQGGDGQAFIVGMRCAAAAESGVDQRKLNVAKAKAERRMVDTSLSDEAFVAWLRAQPHPKGWAGKSRYDDVAYWCRRRTPKMSVLSAARKDYSSGVDGVAILRAEFEALIGDNEERLRSLPHPSSRHPGKSLYDYAQWVASNRGELASGLQAGIDLLTQRLSRFEIDKIREIYEEGKRAESKQWLDWRIGRLRARVERGDLSDEELQEWIGDLTAHEVDPETATLSIPLWKGGRGNRITVRPRKLDPSSWAALRNAVKFGDGRLIWHKPRGRKGRWMVSLSVHQRVLKRSKPETICAVRLGMYTTCTLGYGDVRKQEIKGNWHDEVDIPESTWRQIRRLSQERTERGRWNRVDMGQREGRGRRRKLRATSNLADKVARVTDTAIRQVAAAVVARAVRRNAWVIVLPDLKTWSVNAEMDKTEDLSNTDRAEHRKWYFRWHQGALRQLISEVAEREGRLVLTVDVKGSSTECSGCGATAPEARDGRRWHCPSCDLRTSVERNTSRVLVKRGFVALQAHQAEQLYRDTAARLSGLGSDEEIAGWGEYLLANPDTVFRARIEQRLKKLSEAEQADREA